MDSLNPALAPRAIDYKQDSFRGHYSFALRIEPNIEYPEEHLENLCREAHTLAQDMRVGEVVFEAGSFSVAISYLGKGQIRSGNTLAATWTAEHGLHFFTEKENQEKTEEFRSTFKTASKANP